MKNWRVVIDESEKQETDLSLQYNLTTSKYSFFSSSLRSSDSSDSSYEMVSMMAICMTMTPIVRDFEGVSLLYFVNVVDLSSRRMNSIAFPLNKCLQTSVLCAAKAPDEQKFL